MTETHENRRWDVGLAIALVAGATGLFVGNTVVFMSAAIGVGYAIYGYATRLPESELDVRRSLSTDSPRPGDEVDVTISIMNVGDTVAPEVRVVDTVPEELEVIAGTPRHCTSLQPGEEATVEYTLRAQRGEHEFGDLTVLSRNVSGTGETLSTVDEACTLTSRADVSALALEQQTTNFTGRIPTDVGGDGIEFYETRQYHPTDPMKRVDWKRFARTNELTTIEFRESRAANVVVIVDVRDGNRVARSELEPDAVELCTYAANRLVDALLEQNNMVGVSEFGGSRGYVPPRTGRSQAARVRKVLADGPHDVSLASTIVLGVGRGGPLARLRERMPNDAQVVFVTPVTDDVTVQATQWLEACGHEVTVVSPDLTDTTTAGGMVERIHRRNRIKSMRESGSRVVEWSPTEPLHAAMTRANRRWSK